MRATGGALINVGSALSDRAIPLQGNYCAAKHALKAFTDALRMELEEEGVPIAVTLVKPASIDTPFFEKARTYLGVEPQPVPPVYAPEVVSEVILHAAQHPLRELIAGGVGREAERGAVRPAAGRPVHGALDVRFAAHRQAGRRRRDNLYEPVPSDGGERGRNWGGHTRDSSVYTSALLHPARLPRPARPWHSASGHQAPPISAVARIRSRFSGLMNAGSGQFSTIDYHARIPGTVTAATELSASTLHVGRPAVAQFDRDLHERHVLEMPAPAGVLTRAHDDAAVWNASRAALLRPAGRVSIWSLLFNWTRNCSPAT